MHLGRAGPVGLWASTTSPTHDPSRACAIGEAADSDPARGLASYRETILNVCVRPLARSVLDRSTVLDDLGRHGGLDHISAPDLFAQLDDPRSDEPGPPSPHGTPRSPEVAPLARRFDPGRDVTAAVTLERMQLVSERIQLG